MTTQPTSESIWNVPLPEPAGGGDTFVTGPVVERAEGELQAIDRLMAELEGKEILKPEEPTSR